MAAAELGSVHRVRAHQQSLPRKPGQAGPGAGPGAGPPSWSGSQSLTFFLFVLQVKTLTAHSSKAKYLCQLHLVAGVMTFDTLKKSDHFYTLTGKSAEIDTSEGVRPWWRHCVRTEGGTT